MTTVRSWSILTIGATTTTTGLTETTPTYIQSASWSTAVRISPQTLTSNYRNRETTQTVWEHHLLLTINITLHGSLVFTQTPFTTVTMLINQPLPLSIKSHHYCPTRSFDQWLVFMSLVSLKVTNMIFSVRLAPSLVNSKFNWDEYLNKIVAHPVPHHLFTEVRLLYNMYNVTDKSVFSI